MRFLTSGGTLRNGGSAAASAEGFVLTVGGDGASPCPSACELLAILSG
jgi:hypothetical protein